MKKLTSLLILFCLIISSVFVFAACAENADIATETTVPEFTAIMEKIETMHVGYGNFMNAGEGTVLYKTSDGFTPSETPCFVEYLESEDRVYRLCNLQFANEVSDEVHDEYQYIDDTTLFIVRSYIANADNSIVIDKYVVLNGVLYSIDEEQGVFVAVEKPDSYDFYLSFSELTSLYGDFTA